MSFPLVPYSRRVGVESARVALPVNYTATDGSAVLVLGSDEPGRAVRARMTDFPDYYEVNQQGDLLSGTPVTFVRARVHIRAPTTMPKGVSWRFSARVDPDGLLDALPFRFVANITEDLNLLDLAIPTRGQVTGTNSAIAFRIDPSGDPTAQSGTTLSVLSADFHVFTVNTSTNVFTSVAHGLEEGEGVAVLNGGVLPVPLVISKLYYAVSVTADTFCLSLTADGGPIDITTAGTGSSGVTTMELTIDGLQNQEPASVGRIITISGADEGSNNGQFVVTEYISDSSVKIRNVASATNFGGADAFNGTIEWEYSFLDLELPGVYIDSVVLDTNAIDRPAIINRTPNPDETAVLVGSDIYLELSDPNTGISQIVLADTNVYVNGVLAFNGVSGFQTGFDGAGSTFDSTVDSNRTLTVNIDPTADFAPLSVVAVQVVSRVIAGNTVEYNYSFTTEDTISPALAAATATGRRTFRVTWTEPVVAESPTAANDALNPANWTIELASTSLDDGLPAYLPTVVGVTQVALDTYDLELNDDATAGALYTITANNIEDLFGNPDPASITVLGAACVNAPLGRRFDLLEMLPDMNTSEDDSRDLERFGKCLQEVANVLLCDIDEWTAILDPDTAPEAFIDAMLSDLGNPFAFDLSLNDKRRLIRVLVPIYQEKGTEAGIINAIRFFLGVEVTIVYPAFDDPWLLGVDELGVGTLLSTADLHTRLSFKIVSPVVLDATQRDTMIKIAEYMKDARTHLIQPIEEPEALIVTDHWTIGVSLLGTESLLH